MSGPHFPNHAMLFTSPAETLEEAGRTARHRGAFRPPKNVRRADLLRCAQRLEEARDTELTRTT
ncbi:MAG: hypothetical protein IPO90_09755 [Flavobacteriales bacterium]|nr:hypothetical protein [Flavobacteriales bacterium]